jgi:hypothetical protein
LTEQSPASGVQAGVGAMHVFVLFASQASPAQHATWVQSPAPFVVQVAGGEIQDELASQESVAQHVALAQLAPWATHAGAGLTHFCETSQESPAQQVVCEQLAASAAQTAPPSVRLFVGLEQPAASAAQRITRMELFIL